MSHISSQPLQRKRSIWFALHMALTCSKWWKSRCRNSPLCLNTSQDALREKGHWQPCMIMGCPQRNWVLSFLKISLNSRIWTHFDQELIGALGAATFQYCRKRDDRWADFAVVEYTSPNKDIEDVLKIIYHSRPSPSDGNVDGGVTIHVGVGHAESSETDDQVAERACMFA